MQKAHCRDGVGLEEIEIALGESSRREKKSRLAGENQRWP
jgi:hypothetical protein